MELVLPQCEICMTFYKLHSLDLYIRMHENYTEKVCAL